MSANLRAKFHAIWAIEYNYICATSQLLSFKCRRNEKKKGREKKKNKSQVENVQNGKIEIQQNEIKEEKKITILINNSSTVKL